MYKNNIGSLKWYKNVQQKRKLQHINENKREYGYTPKKYIAFVN
jgi:hypothetical protein